LGKLGQHNFEHNEPFYHLRQQTLCPHNGNVQAEFKENEEGKNVLKIKQNVKNEKNWRITNDRSERNSSYSYEMINAEWTNAPTSKHQQITPRTKRVRQESLSLDSA